MKLLLLRNLLLIDAAVLLLLGGLLLSMPVHVERAFHFEDLPAGVSYIIGLWGCALVTIGLGYVVAAMRPARHVLWVQIGILRGVSECLLGVIYLARGTVTFQQAGFGIIIAGLMAIAYIGLYPRAPRLVPAPKPATPS